MSMSCMDMRRNPSMMHFLVTFGISILFNTMACRYDDMKTAQENIELQTTILSRFDLIFIVKDERSMDRDKMIARHVLNVHKMAGALLEVDEEEQKVLPVNHHTLNSTYSCSATLAYHNGCVRRCCAFDKLDPNSSVLYSDTCCGVRAVREIVDDRTILQGSILCMSTLLFHR